MPTPATVIKECHKTMINPSQFVLPLSKQNYEVNDQAGVDLKLLSGSLAWYSTVNPDLAANTCVRVWFSVLWTHKPLVSHSSFSFVSVLSYTTQ